jgi:Spy/CpxP family protein refolding chaperone
MKKLAQNRVLVLLVIILLLANIAFLVFRFGFKKDQSNGSGRPVKDFVQKELGLTKQQAEKFQALRDEHKKDIRPVLDDMKKLKDSLYDLLSMPVVNDSAVQQLTKEIGEKQALFEKKVFHHFQDVRAICDSAQKIKMDTLVHRMVNRQPWMKKSDQKN